MTGVNSGITTETHNLLRVLIPSVFIGVGHNRSRLEGFHLPFTLSLTVVGGMTDVCLYMLVGTFRVSRGILTKRVLSHPKILFEEISNTRTVGDYVPRINSTFCWFKTFLVSVLF